MLDSLTRMPSGMSSESRRQLLNAVTDLFLLDQDPSEPAKADYGEIALRSLPHLGGEDRKAYADQVASVPSLPRQVAVTLAGDTDAEVARLVLKLSPVLTDTDLAAIAVSQSQQHLVAIAERARLSEGLTDILVTRGDRDVLQTVSSNEGAQFSDKGFDTLLARGGGDAEIGNALVRRSDLNSARASRVLRIVEGLSVGSGLWSKPADEAATLGRRARQQRLEVKLLLTELAAGKRSLDDVLVMLAEEDRAYHLAETLAQTADITNEQALRVLLQRDVSGIAVTCRSLNVGIEAFKALLDLRARRLLFASQDIETELKGYANLDAATAERTMRFLKLKTRIA
jgi:uncharacterized protein (DUF2336 family)